MTINENYFMSLCPICIKKFTGSDKLIYCPDCRELYHLECWKKVGNRCKIKGCKGDTRIISTALEKIILNNLKTDLRISCSKCGQEILILYRYCPNCGFEVNSLKDQRSFPYFPLLKFFHNRKTELAIGIISVVLFMFVIIILINVSHHPIPMPSPQVFEYLTYTQIVFLSPPVNNPTATIQIVSNPTATKRPTKITSTRQTCGGAPPIRVEKGDNAHVTSTCKQPVLMRLNPVVATNAEQYLYSGDELKIIDGIAHCSNDVSFFLVEAPSFHKTGWVAEAEPDSNNYCIQLDP